MTRIVATFEVTGWEQVPYDEQATGARLARATMPVSPGGGHTLALDYTLAPDA